MPPSPRASTQAELDAGDKLGRVHREEVPEPQARARQSEEPGTGAPPSRPIELVAEGMRPAGTRGRKPRARRHQLAQGSPEETPQHIDSMPFSDGTVQVDGADPRSREGAGHLPRAPRLELGVIVGEVNARGPLLAAQTLINGAGDEVGRPHERGVVPESEDVEVREGGCLEPVEDGAVGEGEEHPPKGVSLLRAGGRGKLVVTIVITVEKGAGVRVAGSREREQRR